jgi:hypothetical protein
MPKGLLVEGKHMHMNIMGEKYRFFPLPVYSKTQLIRNSGDQKKVFEL